VDRRSFLRIGAGALGAVAAPALLSACRKTDTAGSGGSSKPSPAKGPPEAVQELLDSRVQAGAATGLEVYQGGAGYLAGMPSYIGFVIGLKGVPSWGHDATVWLVPDADVKGAQVGPLPAPYHAYAKPGTAESPQGVLGATATFDRPGVWYLVAEAKVEGKRRVGWGAYQAIPKEASKVPYPGQPALRTETPTVADHRGVEPICTREPPCDLHRVSLASALGSGKPVLFEVGTPRFCASRTCGPNLDELVAVRDQVGDKAAFIHAEVYVNDKLDTVSRQETTPAFREWGLESEPWLFVVDRRGAIAARFEGPLTATQIKEALTPLL
jgi:hypothetical protein